MDQLLMLTIIFALVGIPAFCAHRYRSFRNGLRMTMIYMAIFMVVYIVIVVAILPDFIF